MKVTAFTNNVDIETDNGREYALEKNFLDPWAGVGISSESFALLNEGYARMMTWIYAENGRFENAAATITSEGGKQYNAFIQQKEMEIGRNRISCGLELRKSFGDFGNKAEGLTWRLLREKGFLPDSLIAQAPYLVVPNDLKLQKAIAIATTMSLIYQTGLTIFEITSVAATAANPTNVAVLIIRIIALAVFLLITIISLVISINQLKELYFPQLRYLKAISDYDLIRKGCEYLGYTFTSNLITSELYGRHTIGKPIPIDGKSIGNVFEIDFNTNDYFNLGYPVEGDTVPTLKSLINHYLTTYNAKLVVYEGSVRIERDIFFQSTASVLVIPTMSEQEDHDTKYTFNDDGAWGRSYDHWQDDFTDYHSLEVNRSMKAEFITEALQVVNADLFHLVGLRENSAPFALAGRKSGFNGVENALLILFTAFDKLISAMGGFSNSAQNILDRDGVMIIENQYFETTKAIWGTLINGEIRQASNYKDFLSMSAIHYNYKLGLNVINNNYKIEKITVPFTDDNFDSLLQNNYVIYEPINQPVEVASVIWKDKRFKAELVLKIPDTSAFNTITRRIA